MGVDNGRVKGYAQAALDRHNSPGDVTTRLDRAWKMVNTQREAPKGVNCGNYSLAAADHYLFMRWAGSLLGPAFNLPLMLGVDAYDGAYKAFQAVYDLAVGGDVVFATGQCKATSFSPMVFAWAQQGIRDGIVDFFRPDSAKLNCPSTPIPVLSNFL